MVVNRIVREDPGGLATLARAALPALPVVGRLPGIRKAPVASFDGLGLTRRGVAVDRGHVDAYARVCGFPRRDTVPVTYPHLLAFPLQLALMADQGFPYAAVGMVHVENTVTAHRGVGVGEVLDVSVGVGAPRPHARGALLDFTTTITGGGGVAWESTSTYLRRGRPVDGEPAAGPVLPDTPSGGVQWRLPGDLGRTYAAVSGDHNPIHLHPLSARALGFPRHIAHGMWTLARSVAAIENRLPDAVRIEAAFRRPVLLPATVTYAARHDGDDWAFALTRPNDGAPHLLGRATPA